MTFAVLNVFLSPGSGVYTNHVCTHPVLHQSELLSDASVSGGYQLLKKVKEIQKFLYCQSSLLFSDPSDQVGLPKCLPLLWML